MFVARINDTCCGLVGSTCGSCGDPRSYGCGAPICTGSPSFIIEGLPVARLLDLTYVGPITSTSQTGLVADSLPIAKQLDITACGFISQVSCTSFFIN